MWSAMIKLEQVTTTKETIRYKVGNTVMNFPSDTTVSLLFLEYKSYIVLYTTFNRVKPRIQIYLLLVIWF